MSPSHRRDTYLLKDVRARVIDRVRSRQSEIETTIFTRILVGATAEKVSLVLGYAPGEDGLPADTATNSEDDLSV